MHNQFDASININYIKGDISVSCDDFLSLPHHLSRFVSDIKIIKLKVFKFS